MSGAPEVQPATAPTQPKPMILFAPHVDVPYRFAGTGSKRRMQRAVLRPIDLTASHGITVRAENIRRLIETYDPAFEAAMLNFDHEWGGPAHGHCVRLFAEGDLLWSDWDRISELARAGMESGEWPRCSSEFWVAHPQTKDWYFTGLALLGSKSPAVPGLPPERWLMERPIYRVINLEEPRSESSEHAAPAHGEETTEKDMKKGTEGTPDGAATTTTPDTPPAPPADLNVAQLSAQVSEQLAGVQADRTALAADRQALAAERAKLRLERAETATEKLLSTKLDKRLTPAQAKLARPLLIALAAAETLAVVKLAGADGKEADVPLIERFVQILEAGPDHSQLFGRTAELIEGEAVTLSASEKAAGITAEKAAFIDAKYADSYRHEN